jgi:hypothetical protein
MPIRTLERRLGSLMRNLPPRNWYSLRRAVVWPESDYKRGMLKRVQKVYRLPYFVETGTFRGETPLALRSFFEHVWTIELDDALYEKSRELLARFQNITCLKGDSKVCLPGIVTQLDKGTLFWLDGHYSGSGTARGGTDSPLIEELKEIEVSRVRNQHVIIIDDISDCCVKEGNTSLRDVIGQLEKINPAFKFYFDYDMLFALPYERQHREFWKKIAYPVVIR